MLIPDPRQHLNGRWTEDVWSGLKLLVESGLELLEPLKFAARSLPREEAERWIELIVELEADNQRWKESIRANDARLVYVIRALNQRWFLPRGTILMRTMRRCEHGNSDAWDQGGIGVGVVLNAASYPLEGEPLWNRAVHRRPNAVTAYHVRWVFPNGIGLNPAGHEGAAGGVILALDRIEEAAKQTAMHLPQAAGKARALVLPHTRTSMVNAWRDHGERMRRRYPTIGAYTNSLHGCLHVRELREAINYARAEREPGEFPDTNLGRMRFFERLIETLLSEGGSIRQRIWPFEPWGEVVDEALATAAIGQPCPAPWREKMDRAVTLSRLSAELTAVTVGPDPAIPVSEWARELHICAAEAAASRQPPDAPVTDDFAAVCGHGDVKTICAMTWAVSLMADAVGLSGPNRGPPLRPPTHGDIARAAAAAQVVLQDISSKLRLPLKAMYDREFNRPVDETPFSIIDANGRLHQRDAVK